MAASRVWTDDRTIETKDYKPQVSDMLMQTALFCNNARFADDEYKGDPTETALLKLARERISDPGSERISEVPFDSDRKRMTTLNSVEGKEYVFTKGAMESVLPLCSYFLMNGIEQKMDEAFRNKATDAYHQLMDKGLRVLAFAYKKQRGARGKGQGASFPIPNP